jgi:hypothetical protein
VSSACHAKPFGPSIVSIDTHGGNLFEKNKIVSDERKDAEVGTFPFLQAVDGDPVVPGALHAQKVPTEAIFHSIL